VKVGGSRSKSGWENVKTNKSKRTGGMAQVVDAKLKALSSIPSTAPQNK
jgi:hypothetical protein